MEEGDARRPRTARAVTAAWPSLLVHPKVMHVPCQSGTTAPWARTLLWSKALRTVGDHLQRLRAHVPMPGGGQTAHCWAGRCTPLHAARSPCRQHEAYWFSATCHLDGGGSISCKETWPHTSCSVGGVGLLGESPCADGEERREHHGSTHRLAGLECRPARVSHAGVGGAEHIRPGAVYL